MRCVTKNVKLFFCFFIFCLFSPSDICFIPLFIPDITNEDCHVTIIVRFAIIHLQSLSLVFYICSTYFFFFFVVVVSIKVAVKELASLSRSSPYFFKAGITSQRTLHLFDSCVSLALLPICPTFSLQFVSLAVYAQKLWLFFLFFALIFSHFLFFTSGILGRKQKQNSI